MCYGVQGDCTAGWSIRLRLVAAPATMQRYFQQIRPLAECDAQDGQRVGQLLIDLVNGKPKELPHAICEFANQTTMLRDSGFVHIGDMLVAILAADAHSGSRYAPHEDATRNPALVTAEQATAIGGELAASVHSSNEPVTAVHRFVDSHSILHVMKMRHAWLVPMLEVLVAPQPSIGTRLTRRLRTMTIAPRSTVDAPSSANFDSVVHC